jgi:L-aspartate oxidase
MSSDLEVRTSDVVVIGSGIAGLATALYLDGRDITVLCKSAFALGGSSERAQGGVAAALGEDDSPELHASDTVRTGCGLTDPEVAALVTRDGPNRMRELLRLGAQIDREPSGSLALGQEAAHSRRRVLHAAGDATGAELVRALNQAVLADDGIRIAEHTMALDLVVDAGRVCGVAAVNRSGDEALYLAPAVVLATGGIGRVFARTTNPRECTGDGLAMAARAGARLAGLEFVQFHPTALADGSDPMALLTEALRGDGAVLIDETGHRFMCDIDPAAELAPRDVVARAIWRHRRDGHQVYLDARSIGDRFPTRFPTVLALCRERGLDPRREPIPVSPAAHYHMGGVVIDHQGRTSLPGLWACGEVACSGLHGANRLASNSLLEALVYGARTGRSLSNAPLERKSPSPGRLQELRVRWRMAREPWLPEVTGEDHPAARIRRLMWDLVGLERTAAGLQRALRELHDLIAELEDEKGELNTLSVVADLVIRAALARTESRGAHFRHDLPLTSPHWQQQLVFEGERMLEPEPRQDSHGQVGTAG